jgi:putative ABC transport system permease protein
MLKSYLTTAIRFLQKNKAFSFINILGLTAGTLCCLYIVLYVSDQYGYDRQHKDVKDIYRIDEHYIRQAEGGALEDKTGSMAAPAAPLIKQNFPEVEQYTRVVPFLGVENHLLHYGDKVFTEPKVALADSTFFDVFTYHFVYGNPENALVQPFSAVLTRELAEKLFGAGDPTGKTFTVENLYFKKDYTVRGVIDESLGKTHLDVHALLSMGGNSLGEEALHTDAWTRNTYVASYIKLRPGTDKAALEAKFPALIKQYAEAQYKTFNMRVDLFLQPVTSIHTTTGFRGYEFSKPVSPTFLNILLLIAFLIQLIACINFMNLSTARASKRAKEVGVRKVIGAGRKDLVFQFLGESFLLSLIGVLLALPLLVLVLPYLNGITQASVQASFLWDYRLWILLAALIGSTAFVAGSYPAFYLSAFRAIKVIKGNFTSHISAAGIRRSLVVFQFVLSIALITGIVVIYCQLNFIKNKDLGFDKEQKLVLSIQGSDPDETVATFMGELRRLAGVQEVSNASTYLNSPSFFSNNFFLRGQSDADQKGVSFLIADEHFTKANGIHLLSGRDFEPTDSSKMLINETYARQLGLDLHTAIGTHLYDDQHRESEIIGVVKDFNYSSLYKNLEGFVIWMQRPHDCRWGTIVLSARTSNYQALLASIDPLWHTYVPGEPFMYTFMDEAVQRQYETEVSLSHIINAFTLMAILISCLGLFGLAAFSAEQRSKEIGIRKVLGASTAGLARLLSRDFLMLVGLAFVIAIPISWWAMQHWLEGFAYRVTLEWWMFGLAGLMSAGIALLTVAFQAVKAARANPITQLRSE